MDAASLAAAGESGPTAFDVHPAAGAAVLAVAVAAALFLAGMLRITRLSKIVPAGATMELRPESPAVVDLLTGGFVVEDDAVPATVVDLAARGWFTIEDYGSDTIIRTRSTRPADRALQPYERRVLDHIERHAIDGVVPTRVLTTGQKQLSQRWFGDFSREVVQHAQQLGLSARRWGWAQITAAWLVVGAAGLPAFVVFDTAEESSDSADWASLGNVLAGLAVVVAALLVIPAVRVSRLHAQRDTPAGVVAASHWLGVRDFYRNTGEFESKSAASVAIWDHHLAYATAFGLAAEVRRQIPFDSEHDRHAWSRATGQWRRVTVRYRTLRPGWGRHPFLVAFTALLTGALFGSLGWAAWNVAEGTWKRHYDEYVTITLDQQRWINLGAITVVVLCIAIVGHAAIRFLLGCADLFRRRSVEGDLVRARCFGGGDDSEPSYHLAIDAATAHTREVDTIRAYRVRGAIYAQVAQGARVRAKVSPALGYVASIETLVPAPHAATFSDGPGAAAAWTAATVGTDLTGAFGGLIGLLARQPGPRGDDLRAQLAQAQVRLSEDAITAATVVGAPPPPPPPGPRFRVVDEPGRPA